MAVSGGLEELHIKGDTVTTVQPPAAIRKQGAWGLWWLTVITFGIYYLVWYDRIGGDLAATTGVSREAWTRWWSQLISIYGLIGLSRTAKRLNQAHTQVGSSTRVSPVVTWLWAPIWFGSHTRYLQRRINILVDIHSSRTTQRAPA
ncbi:MAG: hypothetical protein EOP27_00485 [Rhodococcus sp. (in: high G+C Gram-positive bacteria)]|nr:MAG: hypothetical protein EOP27_00485 [Rhodococcus sp. (in: high G+C Gram-positive bacteria)]